ncbi:MAG TPA: toprim domain-containing protein [Chitinophagales bacterium]|nr:toprim domain-containing protein [Chitinophagales bacterium]
MASFQEFGINVTGSSGTQKVKCPKCQGERKKNKTDTPLFVHKTKGFWICYHCGWGGNLKSAEAENKIRQKAEMPAQAQYSQQFLSWFQKRGISKETLQKLFIYERNMTYKGLKQGHTSPVACFPVFYKFAVVNVKFRPIYDKQFWQLSKDDGAQQVLSGFDQIETVNDAREAADVKIPRIIICEGELDRASWVEAGFDDVVTLPSGATESLPWWGKEMTNLFERVEVVIIAVDDDVKGVAVRNELARRIGKKKCKFVHYPVGCKDANDVLREDSEDAPLRNLQHSERIKLLQGVIQSAYPCPIEGIVRVVDVNGELDRIYKSKLTPGYGRGTKMDRGFTYKAPLVYVFTGTPGSGKTHFILSDFNDLIEYQKKMGNLLKLGIYSPENKNGGRLGSKIISINAGRSYLYNHPNKIEETEHQRGKRFLHEHFVMLFPKRTKEGSNNTLKNVLDLAEVAVKQDGINGLLIDPWNKIEHEMLRGETTDNYISRQLDVIMEFCELFGIFCVIIAHPTKPTGITKAGNHGRVTLYNISGSANWFNKPDVGVVLHRDKFRIDPETEKIIRIENGPTEIHVDKMRFEEIGNETTIEMYYDWYRAGRFVADENLLDERNLRKSAIKQQIEQDYEAQQGLEKEDETIPFIPIENEIPNNFDDDIPF